MMVTIIIPLYNAERLLERCLDSIMTQTYKDLEVLLINDGSTDATKRICTEYCDRDIRFKLINKGNGGPSEARNVGIKNANGEYIVFIDADDYIDGNYIETIVKKLNYDNCNMVILNTVCEFPDNTAHKNKLIVEDDSAEEIFADSVIIDAILKRKNYYGSPWVVWGKGYKRSLFDNIQFPVGRLSEDLAIMPSLINKCNSIAITSESSYHYVLNNLSVSHNYNESAIEDNFTNIVNMSTLVKKVYPHSYNDALIEVVDVCKSLFLQSGIANNRKMILNQIRRNKRIYLHSNKTNKHKLLVILECIVPNATYSIWNKLKVKKNI